MARRTMRSLTRELDKMFTGLQTPELTYQEWDPYLLAQSELGGIVEDPRMKAAQMQALAGYQDIVSQGGLTDVDRARIAEIQQEMNRRERGQREALMQQYAARGLGGSGAEMAAALMGQQEAAQGASMAGLQQAAMAQQARERALGQLGGMGSQVRGQEYEMQANKAAAQDAINRFNTQLRNEAFLRNINEQNRLAQQRFQNQISQGEARMGAIGTSLGHRAAMRQRVAGNIFGALNTVGNLVGSITGGGGGQVQAGA